MILRLFIFSQLVFICNVTSPFLIYTSCDTRYHSASISSSGFLQSLPQKISFPASSSSFSATPPVPLPCPIHARAQRRYRFLPHFYYVGTRTNFPIDLFPQFPLNYSIF